jgi:hypothetical protein
MTTQEKLTEYLKYKDEAWFPDDLRYEHDGDNWVWLMELPLIGSEGIEWDAMIPEEHALAIIEHAAIESLLEDNWDVGKYGKMNCSRSGRYYVSVEDAICSKNECRNCSCGKVCQKDFESRTEAILAALKARKESK